MRLPKPDIKRPELRLPKLELRGRGSSLRGPQVKLPQPVADLYCDLRDKRLLPVMAALVIAMIAVPFVFGESNDAGEQATGATVGAPPPSGAGPATLTVTAAPDPGLRDYKKRLGGAEKNPFKQQYATPETGSGSGGGNSVDSSAASASSASSVASDSGSSGMPPSSGGSGGRSSGGSSGSSGSGDVPSGIKLYGYRPDVLFGVAGSRKLHRHNELPIGTVLPKKQGAVVFLGITENGGRALFFVSPRIVTVKGGGACVGGKRNCEVLSMRAGEAATLVGASPLPVYRLSVVKIALTEIEEKNRQAKAGSSGIRETLGSVQRVQRFSK